MRTLIIVIISLFSVVSAFAQSSPGIYQGQVPTAAQWNSYFANKKDYVPGEGVVSSVGAAFSGGIVSISGSPIVSSGTLTFSITGTSGGIPYFDTASSWNSSGALAAGMPVIGGGAGNPPSTASKSGNTTDFATVSGSLIPGNCLQSDANGNVIDAGASCGGSSGSGTVNGGTVNQLTWYAASGNAVSGLATANNGVLVTNGSGVPSISSTLPMAVQTSITALPLSTGVTGTLSVNHGGTGASAFTAGSIPFAGALGVYSQDNGNLFWDVSNVRLCVGCNSPSQKLTVNGNITLSNANGLYIKNSGGSDVQVLNMDSSNIVRLYNGGGTSMYINPDNNSDTIIGFNNTGTVQIGDGTHGGGLKIQRGSLTLLGGSGILADNNTSWSWKDTGGTYHNQIWFDDTNRLQLGSTFDGGVNGAIGFFGNSSEMARFTPHSNFLVGDLTDPGGQFNKIGGQGFLTRTGVSGSYDGSAFNISFSGGTFSLWEGNTNYGTINLISDYRIKKDVTPLSGNAIDMVNQLKPVSYRYKNIDDIEDDGITHIGFIADQLQQVIPSAVNGEKDALTIDGKIQPQSINVYPIITILAKAVQELSARVTTLEARQ